ncbi:MAG: ATP-binding cassette domain-containing protein [Thermoguttaceae bacterium]
MSTALEVHDLTKQFGRNVALDGVSYSVPTGTVFALLGENGAGKTTTIKILLGLTDPDAGRATVLGLDPKRDDLEVRRRVGYVPEQPVLYDWMTVSEIGKFAAAFHDRNFWAAYCKQIADYEVPLGAVIKTLSKGMRAKVSLALALAHNPELLILDEPTSGLDPLVRRTFLEGMVERAASGKSVFLSSHQIAEVERVADHVAFLKQSRLVLVESVEVLKETTHAITITFTDDAPRTPNGDFVLNIPLQTIYSQRQSSREVSIVGRHLAQDAHNALSTNPNITRFDIRTPSLEEIFVAVMR